MSLGKAATPTDFNAKVIDSSPNPDPSAATATIPLVGLDRPARPATGAVTDSVRSAILVAAKRLRVTPDVLISLHAQAEFLADVTAIARDVEERPSCAR